MALVFPYSLSHLSDLLKFTTCQMNIQRNDEVSGDGWGQMWAAEIAPPLWTAQLAFSTRVADYGYTRMIDAKIRALGVNKKMLFADPSYTGPISDPTGALLASKTVQVSSINANRTSIAFKGLPANFQLYTGDRFSIVHGSSYYYGELSEDVAAANTGITPLVEVFPFIMPGFDPNDSVNMLTPTMTAMVPKDGHVPYISDLGSSASGASLKLIQCLG